MTNNYDEKDDLPFYEKYYTLESALNDKPTLSCKGMLETDPDMWIPIECRMQVMRETDLAYHCTITVYQVDSAYSTLELFGGKKVSWIPKSMIDSCYWICKNVFLHDLKVANRRF